MRVGVAVTRRNTWSMFGHPPIPDPLIIHRFYLLMHQFFPFGAAEQTQAILIHGVYTGFPQPLVGPTRMKQTRSYWSGQGQRGGTREAQVYNNLLLGSHLSRVTGSPMISRGRVSSVTSFCFSITDPPKFVPEVLKRQLSFR